MANKLDLLAQKEQQLRMLNEQLDAKKTSLFQDAAANDDDYGDDYEESKQIQNDDSYDDGAFEDSTHKDRTIKALMQLGQQQADDAYEPDSYKAVAENDYERLQEQDKTIQF